MKWVDAGMLVEGRVSTRGGVVLGVERRGQVLLAQALELRVLLSRESIEVLGRESDSGAAGTSLRSQCVMSRLVRSYGKVLFLLLLVPLDVCFVLQIHQGLPSYGAQRDRTPPSLVSRLFMQGQSVGRFEHSMHASKPPSEPSPSTLRTPFAALLIQ